MHTERKLTSSLATKLYCQPSSTDVHWVRKGVCAFILVLPMFSLVSFIGSPIVHTQTHTHMIPLIYSTTQHSYYIVEYATMIAYYTR